jgi:hypothetical protein
MDGVAPLAEVQVADVIVLEGDRAAVVGPGVRLDDELLCTPEEVDFVAT